MIINNIHINIYINYTNLTTYSNNHNDYSNHNAMHYDYDNKKIKCLRINDSAKEDT